MADVPEEASSLSLLVLKSAGVIGAKLEVEVLGLVLNIRQRPDCSTGHSGSSWYLAGRWLVIRDRQQQQ